MKKMYLPYEVWKDIKDYEGLYQVSNWGRVKSLKRMDRLGRVVPEQILKPAKDKDGYLIIRLSKDGKPKTFKVHRLVSEAFIPNPDNLPIVNHRDEAKTNNHVENLEWCDYKYSVDYGTRNERIAKANRNGKLSKLVYQYTIDGEFVREWPSINEIQRQTGWSFGNISACCCGYKGFKSAYGFRWSFSKILK